jgi:RimJ/RimL family protein N-acetyltransferase
VSAVAHPWERPPAAAAAAAAAAFAAQVPVLVTGRLHLRAPRIDDFAAYAEILAGDDARHLGGPFDREAAWLDFCQLVASWTLRGFGLWSAERRDDGALVGFFPLDHEFGDPEAEVGWFLLPAARGRGYATEAARALVDHAFRALGFPTLVSYVDTDNSASARVAERLGARRDAVAERALPEPCLVYRHPGSDALDERTIQ